MASLLISVKVRKRGYGYFVDGTPDPVQRVFWMIPKSCLCIKQQQLRQWLQQQQRRVVQAVRTRLCLAAIRQWPAAATGGGDGTVGSSVPAGPNILARQHVNLLDGFDEFTEDQSKKGWDAPFYRHHQSMVQFWWCWNIPLLTFSGWSRAAAAAADTLTADYSWTPV